MQYVAHVKNVLMVLVTMHIVFMVVVALGEHTSHTAVNINVAVRRGRRESDPKTFFAVGRSMPYMDTGVPGAPTTTGTFDHFAT